MIVWFDDDDSDRPQETRCVGLEGGIGTFWGKLRKV